MSAWPRCHWLFRFARRLQLCALCGFYNPLERNPLGGAMRPPLAAMVVATACPCFGLIKLPFQKEFGTFPTQPAAAQSPRG